MHLLKAKEDKQKRLRFYLIGVLPEYQNKGVTAIIFEEFWQTFNTKGIELCVRGPELDDNEAIQKLWKNFKPVTHKRRCTFKKSYIIKKSHLFSGFIYINNVRNTYSPIAAIKCCRHSLICSV